MADVQRAGGIRRYELDLHRRGVFALCPTVALLLLQDARDDREARIAAQPEVDEARAGDIRIHIAGRKRRNDVLRELARLALQRLSELQGDVGGEVAVLGLARALDEEGRVGMLRRNLAERGTQRRFDLGLGIH